MRKKIMKKNDALSFPSPFGVPIYKWNSGNFCEKWSLSGFRLLSEFLSINEERVHERRNS